MFPEGHICDADCEVIWSGVGRPPKPWCKRFADKFEVDEWGCWIWISAAGKSDAQRNRLNFATGVETEPHATDACRWIYTKMVGPIPEGMQIDHTCEDWRCVNWSHLEPVTPLENQRRYRKTRARWVQRDHEGKFRGRKEVVS